MVAALGSRMFPGHSLWPRPRISETARRDRADRLLLRPDVPVRLPDLDLDPRRAGPARRRARHHVEVLLARRGEPRRRETAPVGAAVVVRVRADARRHVDPTGAG